MLTRLKIWLGITPKEVMFEKAVTDALLASIKAPAKKAPAKKAPAKKVAKTAPAKKVAKKAPAKKTSGGGKGKAAL